MGLDRPGGHGSDLVIGAWRECWWCGPPFPRLGAAEEGSQDGGETIGASPGPNLAGHILTPTQSAVHGPPRRIISFIHELTHRSRELSVQGFLLGWKQVHQNVMGCLCSSGPGRSAWKRG